MNQELFNLINGMALKSHVLDNIMLAFSKYAPYVFILITAIMYLNGIFQKNADIRKTAVSTIVFTAINLVIGSIIGVFCYVDRPFVHHKVKLLFSHVADASFPSDHALGTMSIALGTSRYSRLLGRVMILFSIIVGFSRIYVGHHYPLDIIGAYLIVFSSHILYNLWIRSRVEGLYDRIEAFLTKRVTGHAKTLQ